MRHFLDQALSGEDRIGTFLGFDLLIMILSSVLFGELPSPTSEFPSGLQNAVLAGQGPTQWQHLAG
jgi:hypothetical protein